MDRDTVLHGQHLNVPLLASLNDSALPISALDGVAAVGNFGRQFRDYFLPVREKVPALPGALTRSAPQYLVE